MRWMDGMAWTIRILLTAVWCVMVITVRPAAAQEKPIPVDLELAFVVDASGSIDEEETRLQRQGYLDALINPRVVRAITGGFLRSVALAYIEFAADGCERLSVPWTRVYDKASAAAFGQRILAQPPMFCPGGNAVGDAIAFATVSIDENPFEGTRRIIDFSGDGPNTLGMPAYVARDEAVRQGITINGLVIERPTMPDLEDYFRSEITGGPGSFVVKAESRQTFAAAILKKLILEIAAR